MTGQIISVVFADGHRGKVLVYVAGANRPLEIEADNFDEASEVYEYWTNIWENGNQFLEMNL